MASLETLRSHGWHITQEGLNILTDNGIINDVRSITKRALDLNIRDFGAPIITSELNKSTFGPINLQIVKLRNISAPKSKQSSQGAPRMLKLILTDGHENCQGIEIKNLPFLSLDKTIPGTKILINGAPILSGSILLTPENCKILGGNVSALVEKWEVSKLMLSNINRNESGGPPPWVNFGKRIVNTIDNKGFKSLENKNKDNSKNSEFQSQRQDLILEATQGAVKKVFGGGVKPAQTFNDMSNNRENINRAPRVPKGKKEKLESEKMEKPSQGVSLFDFLEDKLSLSDNTQSKTTQKVFNDVPVQKYYENKLNSSQKQSNKFKPAPYRPEFNQNPKMHQSEPRFQNEQKTHQSDTRFQNEQKIHQSETRFQNEQRIHQSETRFQNEQKTHQSENRFQNQYQFAHSEKKFNQSENRFQSDKPPRFQKQRQDKFSGEPRPKPNTNIFVDKLANEINNISLYNSKYENDKLKQPTRSQEALAKTWKWKVGDKCMAKYWEDDKFYNAIVTGITNKTCMVEFVDYGNFEEVLHCDCIPITNDKDDRKAPNRFNNDNQDFSGSLEFRRGKTRPYVKNFNKPGENKNFDS